jgi:hypothetical protein
VPVPRFLERSETVCAIPRYRVHMSLSPRVVALVGLAALAPGVTYVLTREAVAAVTLLNVVLIVASLWVALSPQDNDTADGAV